MSTIALDQHIEITPGVMGGKPRVAGHRISVEQIATWHLVMGMTVDQIASEFTLTLGDVHAALAYYFDHREEIDQQRAESAKYVEELKKSHPSLLRERLNALGH